MLSLNNIYLQVNWLCSNYSEYLTLFSLLIFIAGIVCGGVLNLFIRYFPLRLKARWFKESVSCLQLDYSDLLRLNRKPFSSKAVCRVCRNSDGCSDKTPLLCWLINKGRSRRCSRRFSGSIGIELFTAVITLLAYWRFQSTGSLLAILLFSYLLIALMFIDFQHLLLPNELTLSLLWLGLIFNLNGAFIALNDAVIGAVAGYLSLWGFYWLVKLMVGVEGLGYGDFKLMAALGAWFGWHTLSEILLLGCIIGLCCLIVVYFYKDKTVLVKPIPLGGYLSLAGLIILFKH